MKQFVPQEEIRKNNISDMVKKRNFIGMLQNCGHTDRINSVTFFGASDGLFCVSASDESSVCICKITDEISSCVGQRMPLRASIYKIYRLLNVPSLRNIQKKRQSSGYIP